MVNPKRTCPKCLQQKRLTRHHILPKRYFKGKGPIIEICRECHDQLEIIISAEEYSFNNGKRKRLKRGDYYLILARFFKGG